MSLADPPSAIFCANDLMAIGCYDALRELGLSIPSDVAVMGYDDRELSRYMRPPLTTIFASAFRNGRQRSGHADRSGVAPCHPARSDQRGKPAGGAKLGVGGDIRRGVPAAGTNARLGRWGPGTGEGS